MTAARAPVSEIFSPRKQDKYFNIKHLKNTSTPMTLRYIIPFLILFFRGNSGISAQTRELTDGTEFFFGIPQCGIVFENSGKL